MNDELMTVAQAPGCFASPSVFSIDSHVCQTCVAYASCGDASMKTLEAIREVVDVSDILKRHQAARQRMQNRKPKPSAPLQVSPIPVTQPAPITEPVVRSTPVARVVFEIAPHDQEAIDRIGQRSVKARDQAFLLCKNNKITECRAMLPHGRNPFAQSGPSFMRVACDMLIGGGFSSGSLKAALMERLGWRDGSAGPHASIVVAMLTQFGIVVAQGQFYVLNPALRVENV